MPPKILFSKDEIIESAFRIANEEGINHITVRKVADILGCSVAPIYVNFKTIQELIESVVRKCCELHFQYVTTPYSNLAFLNMGIGTIKFANDHAILYYDMIMNKELVASVSTKSQAKIIEIMRTDSVFKQLTDFDLENILWKMQIFTHGLANILATKVMGDVSLQEAIDLLVGMGNDVIFSAISSANNKYLDIVLNNQLIFNNNV